jgi:hypothetical protein
MRTLQSPVDEHTAVIDAMVRWRWPDAAIEWEEDGDTEIKTMRIRNNCRRCRLTFTYEALG